MSASAMQDSHKQHRNKTRANNSAALTLCLEQYRWGEIWHGGGDLWSPPLCQMHNKFGTETDHCEPIHITLLPKTACSGSCDLLIFK